MAESVQSTLHASRSASHTVGLKPDRELTCRRKRSRFFPNTQPGPLPQSAPMAALWLRGFQNSGYPVKLIINPFPVLTRKTQGASQIFVRSLSELQWLVVNDCCD